MPEDRPFEQKPEDGTFPDLEEVWAGSSIDPDRVWGRVVGGLSHSERVPLALSPRPRYLLSAAAFSIRGVAAALIGAAVVSGLLIGVLLGTSGNARAGFLDEVIELSARTDAAFADGELTNDELETLTVAITACCRLEAGEDLSDLDVAEIDAVLGALAAVCSDLVVAAAVGNVSLDDGDGESPIADLASVSVGVRQRRSALFNGSVLVTLSSHASAIALEQVVALGDLPLSVVAEEAASVEISALDGALSVSRVSAADGWDVQITTPSGQRVAVTFSDGATSVHVQASLDGDEVVIETESEEVEGGDGGEPSEAAGDDDDQNDEALNDDDDDEMSLDADGGAEVESFVVGTAGIVVLEYTDRVIQVLSVTPNPDWTS